MKETIIKIKNRFHRELDREPTESERRQTAKNRGSSQNLVMIAFMIIIVGFMYLMAQPMSFTGEIVLSGGVDGNIISDTTLSNYSDSLNTTDLYTNFNATIDKMDGEIRMSGSYEMPMYAYYGFLSYLEE